MVRGYWSESLCFFEKCVNNKYVLDNKYDIYERALTFEGQDYLVEHSTPPSPQRKSTAPKPSNA